MDKVSGTNGKKSADKPRSGDHPVDADAFARLLDEKVVGGGSKASEKEHDMISEHHGKKRTAQENKELDEQFRQRMGLKHEAMVGSRQYLFDLSLKDRGTLSLSEKEALHLGEFSKSHLDVQEFQQALSDKGVRLQDLSFAQVQTLTQCRTREELRDKVDTMDLAQAAEAQGIKGPRTDAQRSTHPGDSPISAAYTDTKAGVGHLPPGLVNRENEALDARRLQREDVIKQIMTHIDVTKLANATEVSLRLNPEFLGDMRIKLNFEGHGNVAADFETTSRDTKDLLDEGLDGLRSSFSRQGMTLSSARTHLVDNVG